MPTTDASVPAPMSTVSLNFIQRRFNNRSIQALVLANKPKQQPSNQLQALTSKSPASVMPKPQWHAPWKLMRVSLIKLIQLIVMNSCLGH
jgi:hypothetical protein